MKPLGKEVAEIKANKAADDNASAKIDMSKVKEIGRASCRERV